MYFMLTVNDEAVSDGTKGCDRAALIFKCSVEKAPQVSFSIFNEPLWKIYILYLNHRLERIFLLY